ncbi:MAG: hypothetical protein IVW56_03670 [Candidatus Binataceae bacterium]|nr:hypothetical protein [Candidatus Binataceae bacterium]
MKLSIRILSILIAVFFFLLPLKVWARPPIQLPRSRLASSDWSSTAPRNLASNPPAKSVVEGFIRSLQIAKSGFSAIEPGGVYVCSFQFADLRRQGFLSLVAGLGIVDRPSCAGIVIIDGTKQGFEFYSAEPELFSLGNRVSAHRSF